MKNILKYSATVFFILTLFLNSCSAIYGGSTSSEGDQDITEDQPSELVFEADVNSTAYRTVSFANTSEENFEMTNLAFVDNVCGAFSVINVTDSSGNVLYQTGEKLSVSVAAGKIVDINIRFSPQTCLDAADEKLNEYAAYLVIYFTKAEETLSRTTHLIARVTDNTEVVESCGSDSKTYNDSLSDPTPSRTLQPTGKYYIRIDKMRAYIQPSGGFADKAIGVGTDINLDAIDPDNFYEPIYIGFDSDGNGGLKIDPIDSCDGFRLPSPVTDVNLRGADSVLTTDALSTGNPDLGLGTVVLEGDDIGKMSFPTFKVYLEANINNSESLIQDEVTGKFAITVEVATLTSGVTAENSYLDAIALLTDDDGNPFLPVQGEAGSYYLQGSNLRHGAVRLVGIGTFVDENFFGSSVAHTALIENEAYIFLEIQGLVTTSDDD